jgi:NADP-dependent 3-hydroxy acid dehydrogenase YdfG
MAEAAKPDSVAIVTGAAGGTGSHCARLLTEDGWGELLLCDIDEARLEATATPLREKGVTVDVVAGEITASDFMAQLLDAAGTRPIAAVIHTAGVALQMAECSRSTSMQRSH